MVQANAPGGTSTTIVFDAKNPPPSEPTDEHVTLHDRHGMAHDARVTCGSFSSLAVVLEHGSFSVGDAVEVDYGGAMIPASVRRAYHQPDGKWIVVLRWGQAT